MGWANYGEDSQGRPIGYAHEAICDHPSCDAKIDRGLSYACGDMHGDDEISCEKYFCDDHLGHTIRNDQGEGYRICDCCFISQITSGEWEWDDEEGEIIRKKE